MKVGLVGFAGSGKTTLFSALTGGKAAEGGAPSVDIAVVPLEPDERLRLLAELVRPKKVTPASFELLDLKGIAPGESSALALAREDVDGLVLVIRGFATADYFYPRPEPDPAGDLRDLGTELLISDLDIVTRRVEKLEASVKKPTPHQEEERRELALLAKVRERLEEGTPVRDMVLEPDEEKTLRGFGLLTGKPRLVLLSLPDEDGAGIEEAVEVRVKLEAELLELEPSDRAVFMEELGVDELRLPGLPDRMMRALGRIRFYTMNDREVRAWDLPEGSDAVTAAGRVHSDLARGFIRAEVVASEDLRRAGDMKKAKAAGAVRVEGKGYVVRDGDVVQVRFSV